MEPRVEVRLERGNNLYRPLLRLARPYWTHLCAILGLSMVAVPVSLMLALPLKIAVDNVIGNQPLPHLLGSILPASLHDSKGARLGLAVGLLLTLSLIMNLQAFLSWLLQTYTGERLVLNFRTLLFWHVQRMDLLFHDRRGTTDVAYRIQHDAPAIQYIFLQGFVPLLSATLSFTALVCVTMRLDLAMAAIAVSVSPVLFLLARNSGKRARAGWNGIKKLDSSAMQAMYEALASIRLVKAFGQERFEDERFKMRSRQRMMEQVKVASTQASFHVLMATIIAGGTAAALWVGVRHVMQGRLTLGELLLVMAYMGQLYEPLRTISSKLPELQSWLVSVQRALSLMEEAPEVTEDSRAPLLDRAQGQVSFCNVTFSYPTSGRALDKVSFAAPAGTRVGIIGASGSGKSTLVNLLTRFYDPDAGQILLDGRDLRGYRLNDLRRQFAIILQDPVVFSATVAENIAYGRPEASREEVVRAGRAAMAHDFIMALPNGYDTPIGEGGCRLSGGERQRLAIARAFLKDAPVLIFDEPTSAVDIHTEREIMDATAQLIKGRTTFVIAHRLSTVRHCDLLLVLKQGRLQAVTSDFDQAMRALADERPAAAGAAAVAPGAGGTKAASALEQHQPAF